MPLRSCWSLLLLVLTVSTAGAQQDTAYFDLAFKPSAKSAAAFFRPPPVPVGDRFHVRDYYKSGVLQMDGYYTTAAADTESGHFIYFDSSGRKQTEADYSHGKMTGQRREYNPQTGALARTETYENGDLNGEVVGYYESGPVRRREQYKAGAMTDGHCYAKDGTEVRYVPAEQLPAFKGDVSAYFMRTLHYPKTERRNGRSGRVIIKFVVDEQGQVIQPIVEKSVSPGLDAEALRVVQAMPAWQPGMQEGVPVKVYYRLPVLFRLED